MSVRYTSLYRNFTVHNEPKYYILYAIYYNIATSIKAAMVLQ